MPFDLVIFDCDGVLVDSEPIANRVDTEQLNSIGLNLTVFRSMAELPSLLGATA